VALEDLAPAVSAANIKLDPTADRLVSMDRSTPVNADLWTTAGKTN
jgi:hypothetical protein